MKKILFLVLLIPVVFYSCKKDNKQIMPEKNLKKYQVQFGVNGFQQIMLNAAKGGIKVNSLTSAESSTGNALTLDYLVYDSSGKPVHNFVQPADPVKTIVKDSLPAGTYTFCFVIGGSSRKILTASQELYYPTWVWEDTFVKQITVTVGGGDVTQNVTLDRLVAQLEADITGTIPPNAAKLTIKVDKEYVYGKFSGQPNTATTAVSRTATFPITSTTNKFSLLLLNTANPFNVELTAYDASGSILAKANVNNVKCVANTRTVLTGALFGSQGSTFMVSLNNQWVTDPFKTINF